MFCGVSLIGDAENVSSLNSVVCVFYVQGVLWGASIAGIGGETLVDTRNPRELFFGIFLGCRYFLVRRMAVSIEDYESV